MRQPSTYTCVLWGTCIGMVTHNMSHNNNKVCIYGTCMSQYISDIWTSIYTRNDKYKSSYLSCGSCSQSPTANRDVCAVTCVPCIAFNSLFDEAVQVSFAAMSTKARGIG